MTHESNPSMRFGSGQAVKRLEDDALLAGLGELHKLPAQRAAMRSAWALRTLWCKVTNPVRNTH